MIKTETSTPGTTPSTTTHVSTTHRTEHGKVVLITGGGGGDFNATAHSAEIFLPNSPDKHCILPELPAAYVGHTQDRGMICGGIRTENTCRQWNSTAGNFPSKTEHEFKPGRSHHVSWTPVSGKETFLFGGQSRLAMNTSTLLRPGKYEGIQLFYPNYPDEGACSIPDPDTDTVIITGGYRGVGGFSIKASLYNTTGFMKNLGTLNHGRANHGCTSYISKNKRVCSDSTPSSLGLTISAKLKLIL